ncbi:MAG: beta-lactamase, partial [Bacteroidetes bacterium]|nr:beta-lactamase [Bacteroidota bacterium]
MNLKLLFFFFLFSITAKAQTADALYSCNKTDALVREFLLTWKIKGGAVAITKNGNLIYNKGFGFSDKNDKQPIMPNTLFRVASVSKPITSIAIMKLIDEGK